jgi:3-deoxy-manno-octulosonate cytidylyltransferase (CMP-KDO synthetase)
MQTFIGIIPSRYESSRFPGKSLVDIAGKPMIQHVYERAKEVLDDVVVATDDERIFNAVKAFGGLPIMTSTSHQSGTDRCAEALTKFEELTLKSYSVAINIQGDEPFIKTEQIELIKTCFEEKDTQIATLIKIIDDNEIIFDRNRPKVIIDQNDFAIYFSRSPIPNMRDAEEKEWHLKHKYFQHIGMYAFKRDVLKEITDLSPTPLERAESLEQLRWLENGYRIKTAITDLESYGIDTREDLENAFRLGYI